MKLGLVWLQNAAPRSLGWPEQKLFHVCVRGIKTYQNVYKNETTAYSVSDPESHALQSRTHA